MPHKDPEARREYQRQYARRNRETINANLRRWKRANPEKVREDDRMRRLADPSAYNARALASQKRRRAESDGTRIRMRAWKKQRFDNDTAYRLEVTLRNRIGRAFSRYKKGAKSVRSLDLVGCTMGELRAHLEAQFVEGMSWENHGLLGWHIDHKVPCAAFDLSDPVQQRACFHFTNLQPLWHGDNIRKGCRVTPDTLAEVKACRLAPCLEPMHRSAQDGH